MTPPAAHAPLTLVKAEIVDAVGVVTINRPGALNSINPAVVHQLQQTFDRLAADPQVEGIVIGAEGKAFVAGADLDFFLRNMAAGDISRIVQFTVAGHRLLDSIERCPKRVVARVHGAALGCGVEMALACHHVVACPAACFGLPETGLGIYPGFGGTQRTPRAVGAGLAKWLIFTGKTISAVDAWKIGLIDEVVPLEKLDAAACALALNRYESAAPPEKSTDLRALEQFFLSSRVDDLWAGTAETHGNPLLARAMKLVGSKSPAALLLAERFIDEAAQRTLPDGLRLEIEHLVEIFSSPDTQQRLRSFRAKRLG